MSTTVLSIPITSQNGLRQAQRQVRDWLVAHAASQRSRAEQAISGSDKVKSWHDEDKAMDIHVCRVNTDEQVPVTLSSVHLRHPDQEKQYQAQVLIAHNSQQDQHAGFLFAVVYQHPDLQPP